jgi:hypothetical protein
MRASRRSVAVIAAVLSIVWMSSGCIIGLGRNKAGWECGRFIGEKKHPDGINCWPTAATPPAP